MAAALAAGFLGAGGAEAYCPSYYPPCSVKAYEGTNPTTAEWNAIFDLVSQGPTVWGNKGPTVGDIGQGCGKPEPLHSVPARFPCELLKSIAMVESGWRQFCVPTTPISGGNARTIISFDCGYGVGQVTSGMQAGEMPDFDRDRVAYDPTYNLATGTRILAGKWKATNCVGDNQPKVIEDWYIATWAYNGLAYTNHPAHPSYSSNRGVWNPSVGGSAPYQEKVFGWIEYTQGKWTPTPLAYPNPGDITGTFLNNGTVFIPDDLAEPDCASPTDCANHRSTHLTACDGTTGTGGTSGVGGSPGVGGSAGGGGVSGSGAGVGGSGAGVGVGAGGQGGDKVNAGEPNDDGGCGCRIAGDQREMNPLGLLLGMTAVAGFAIRRQRER